MITVWAALESMAARLAAQRASDEEIRSLRRMFTEFEKERPADHMDEYSEANITFHQTIVAIGGCGLIVDMTENLFIHMRGIRKLTIGQDHRADRSIVAISEEHTSELQSPIRLPSSFICLKKKNLDQ